ncbi:MAG TPA: hypothetical protein PKC29_09195 [Thermodesulfobacteriota bacterium]|nr:hypothetical protein [Thermodesulfobacteriota bacterium]
MTTKEKIIAEIDKIPERYHQKLYSLIKQFETETEGNAKSEHNLLARLRQVKIEAPSDFSTKLDIYDLDRKDAE